MSIGQEFLKVSLDERATAEKFEILIEVLLYIPTHGAHSYQSRRTQGY